MRRKVHQDYLVSLSESWLKLSQLLSVLGSEHISLQKVADCNKKKKRGNIDVNFPIFFYETQTSIIEEAVTLCGTGVDYSYMADPSHVPDAEGYTESH